MSNISIFTPKYHLWAMRLMRNETTQDLILKDKMTFALWYSVMELDLKYHLPDDLQDKIAKSPYKNMEFEKLLDLIDKFRVFRYTQPNKTSSERIVSIMIGIEIHNWALLHKNEWQKIIEKTYTDVEELAKPSTSQYETPHSYPTLVTKLAKLVNANNIQSELLLYACMISLLDAYSEFMTRLLEERYHRSAVWTTMLDTSYAEMHKALQPTNPLMLSDLLEFDDRYGAKVNAGVVECLLDGTIRDVRNVTDLFIEPFVYEKSSATPAIISEEDMSLAKALLTQEHEQGINILLFGSSQLDRKHAIRELAQQANKTLWRTKSNEYTDKINQKTLVFLAHDALKDRPNTILLIEKTLETLSLQTRSFWAEIFGLVMEDTHSEEELAKHILSQYVTPTIWMTADATKLPNAALARFLAHLPLKKADRNERQRQFEEHIKNIRLTKDLRDKICKLEGVSTLQVEAAVRAAKMAQPKTPKERDQWIYQSIKRSLRSMGREAKEIKKESVTQYSLKYLNSSGRFGPTEILNALNRSRKGTMVLYGPPGTGKTQFAEYLSTELGIPLVSKKASDLLSKWVGDNEKNIAAMFEEAASEDAMLLLDEGDSFLRDRSEARDSWQVTGVNELLQHMERFDGIFIVCTNLFTGLDAAALRRFTFKMEFLPLTPDQKWEMFLNETGLRGNLSKHTAKIKEDWMERLIFMQHLCAGDFATVKRQCKILDVVLSPEEWLIQLEMECKLKKTSTYKTSMA